MAIIIVENSELTKGERKSVAQNNMREPGVTHRKPYYYAMQL